MNEELIDFLNTFANGRYSRARLQVTPESCFLILDEGVKATTRQLAILEGKVSKLVDRPLSVIRHSNYLREAFLNALSSMLFESLGLTVEGASFELVSPEKANVYLAVTSEHSNLTSDIRNRVVQTACLLGKPLGIATVELELSGQGSSPINDVLILREVLKVAPVNAKGLTEILNTCRATQQHFKISDIGLMLDRLRRKGLLVWQPSGNYVPAQKALYLFSSPKSRRSSDVMRALELGRKRW